MESHRQGKLESSLVSGVAEESNHQIGRLGDGLCPTVPDISYQHSCSSWGLYYLRCTLKDVH